MSSVCHAFTEWLGVQSQRVMVGARKDAITRRLMGQILHNCARTTAAAVRRAIQHSQESLLKLAERYDLNPKTVQKWRRRCFVEDAPMGPKEPHSTTLTREQEAIAVAFRKHTLLPLDDCLYALQATIPQLTRSALHRCFQRHGTALRRNSSSYCRFTRFGFGSFMLIVRLLRPPPPCPPNRDRLTSWGKQWQTVLNEPPVSAV